MTWDVETRLAALATRTLPHRIETCSDAVARTFWLRPVFDEPTHAVVRVKHFGKGRSELVGKFMDLQRIANASVSPYRVRGKRVKPDEQSPEDVLRSISRAQSNIRDLCLQMGADRMLTFTTRKVMSLDALYVRFVRWREAYAANCRRLTHDDGWKFLFIAVPERHPTNPDHWHLHVAATGFFYLQIALQIWHAMCADDFSGDSYETNRHGAINVLKFVQKSEHDDVPSIIAGYIAKYVGKSLDGGRFNKRRYWSSHMGPRKITYVICQARTMEELIPEIVERFGLDLASVLLCHKGAFFMPDSENMVWFKLTKDTYRRPLPV